MYIKEEFDAASVDLKIEPAVNLPLIKEELSGPAVDLQINPLVNLLLNTEDDSIKDCTVEKQNQITAANYSTYELVIKEDPPQDYLVSK